MSVTPAKPIKRTQFLVKDILFQEKYKLSNTEVDIMSYIFNAITWAFKVNGHLTITSKKFSNDLPQIGEKTVEASLRTLKNMELIETDMVFHPTWKANVRGIKITSRGMEYAMKLYKPSEEKIKERYESEIEHYQTQLDDKTKTIKTLERSFQAMKDFYIDNPVEGTKPEAEGFRETMRELEKSKLITLSEPFVEHQPQDDNPFVEQPSQEPLQEEQEPAPKALFQEPVAPIPEIEIQENPQEWTMMEENIEEEEENVECKMSDEELDEIHREMREAHLAHQDSLCLDEPMTTLESFKAYEKEKANSPRVAEMEREVREVINKGSYTTEEAKKEEATKQSVTELVQEPKKEDLESENKTEEATKEAVKELDQEPKEEEERVIDEHTSPKFEARPFEKDFEMLIASVKRDFGHTSEPICNRVDNGWAKETTFYINSYNKLAVVTPDGESRQLKEPEYINKFWKWLFVNQEKIGDVFDFKKHKEDVTKLNQRYRGTKIQIDDIKVVVQKIVSKGEGVNIYVKSKKSGQIVVLTHETKPLLYTPKRCEEIILKFKRTISEDIVF